MITALIASLSLLWYKRVIKNGIRNIYVLALILVLHFYPSSIVTGGVLNPYTGDIIYIGILLSILSYIKER